MTLREILIKTTLDDPKSPMLDYQVIISEFGEYGSHVTLPVTEVLVDTHNKVILLED